MNMTRQSIEILLDLIEIKINALQIEDREDARELNKLRRCRQELMTHHGAMRLKKKQGVCASSLSLPREEKKPSFSRY